MVSGFRLGCLSRAGGAAAAGRAGGAAGGEPRGGAVAVDGRDADDRLEPEHAARVDDPHGDLAAVGDEDAPDRHAAGSTRNSGSPYSASSGLRAQTSTTVPDTPALTAFIIFMTSIRHTTVSASTCEPTSTNGASPGALAR